MLNSYKFEPYEDHQFPLRTTAVGPCTLLIRTTLHEDAEFLYISRGEVTVYLGAIAHTCRAGDIMYIAPHTVHSATADTPDATIRGLVFRMSLLQSALEEREYLRALACGDLYFPVSEQPEKAALLTDLFWKTYDAFDAHRLTYRMESRAWLTLMISEVIGNAVTEEEAPPDVNYRRIQPALDYIEAHYAEHIVLSDLSALLNVSEDHFIRLFKRVTRRTPFSYILDYRIEQALKLLGGDEYSISQISDMTGFSNVQYFSQAFKSRVGVSPSIYRNPKRPF